MERIPEFIGNHLFLVALFVAILVLLLWNVFGTVVTGVRQIDPTEATFLMNREGAMVLDVRAGAEYQGGHILNAVNIPDGELASRQKELDTYRSKPVITCCQNGALSARVARLLRAGGFERLYCLRGGLAAWRNANLPLTRDTDKANPE